MIKINAIVHEKSYSSKSEDVLTNERYNFWAIKWFQYNLGKKFLIIYLIIMLLFCWQLQKQVVNGELPCSKEEAVTLASIQLHIQKAWPEMDDDDDDDLHNHRNDDDEAVYFNKF